jgi:hypothetical protein
MTTPTVHETTITKEGSRIMPEQTERYFVCEDCAHQWNAPEFPDECEACRKHPASISECADADDQDDFSADIRERIPHVGHFSRLGGTWWCDTCNSPYCEQA